MNYEPIFENSVNARLLVKLTQYTIIVFWRNVEQYFHGARTSNPVDYVRVRLPADIVRRFSESVNIRFSKSCG